MSVTGRCYKVFLFATSCWIGPRGLLAGATDNTDQATMEILSNHFLQAEWSPALEFWSGRPVARSNSVRFLPLKLFKIIPRSPQKITKANVEKEITNLMPDVLQATILKACSTTSTILHQFRNKIFSVNAINFAFSWKTKFFFHF